MNVVGKVRKKILHILPEPSIGGMELVAVKLACTISEMDHVFCFLYQRGNSEILDILSENNLTAYVLDKKDGLDFSLVRKIIVICRDENINIIHCRNFSATLYGCLSNLFYRKIKLISDVRGVEFKGRRLMAYKLLSRMNLISRFLAVSNDIKKIMINRGIEKNLVECIPNGVDLTLFAKKMSKIEFRHKYELPYSKIIIGVVGRLEKIKNYPLVIKAFAKLCLNFKNIHLVVVGEGSQHSELTQLAEGIAGRTFGNIFGVSEIYSTYHECV